MSDMSTNLVRDDAELIRKVRLEHERLREITGNLLGAVNRPLDVFGASWQAEVKQSFEHFRAHMIHRIALAEIGGFLNMVEERRPTLSAQVQQLREKHAVLINAAGGVMARLRQACAEDIDELEQCALAVKMLLTEVKSQEEAESLLVSYAFNQEIGGEE